MLSAVLVLAPLAAAQAPEIYAAGWQAGAPPCPPGLTWDCSSTPSLVLSVAGVGFGAGSPPILQKGDFFPSPPPLPTAPWDLPAGLSLDAMVGDGRGNAGTGCVLRSLYTDDGYHYTWCPFRGVDMFLANGFTAGSLGRYAGVIRDFNNVNCPGANAIVGQQFLDGDFCEGRPRTANITFSCIDVAEPALRDHWTRRISVYAASTSADGCDRTLQILLPQACDGARFGMCGSPLASPNPSPMASPVPTYAPAFVTAYSDTAVTAWMQGSAPPPTVRVQRAADGALSEGWAPEGPGPIQPSATPIPVPFPAFTFRTIPKAGRVGECTPITFIIEGFTPADVVTPFTHGVRARFPLSSNGFTQAQLQGVPRSANGNPPVVPPNGLLNLTLECAPSNPQASLGALPFTFDLQVSSWNSICGSCGTQTIRTAGCGDPTGCTWTYLPAATPDQSPSSSSAPFPSDSPSFTPGVSPSPSATTFATLPVISVAGWVPLTTGECPPGLPWPCSAPMVALTLAGDGFGASPGAVEYGALLPRTPAPPLPPWDLPPALFRDALTLGGPTPANASGACQLRTSLPATNFVQFDVCPYERVSVVTRGFVSGSAGRYVGVARANNVSACDSGSAITGLLFDDGDLCNGAPRRLALNFVCLDVADPDQDEFDQGPRAWAGAPTSPDGCEWALDVPLAAACAGAYYGLCAAPAGVASPNPPPSPSPVFSYSQAFATSWTDGLVRVLARAGDGGAPPPALRVRRADGALSAAAAPAGPGPLAPTPSAAPSPFPTALTVTAISPAGGYSDRCTPVWVALAGVTAAADLAGVEAGFEVAFQTSPLQYARVTLDGSPQSVDGRAPVVPANGVLNLSLACAPVSVAGDVPRAVTLLFRSRFRGSGAFTGFLTARDAVCAADGGCAWTYYGAAPPPPQPSPTPGAAAAAGAPPAVPIAVGVASGVCVALLVAGGAVLAGRRRAQQPKEVTLTSVGVAYAADAGSAAAAAGAGAGAAAAPPAGAAHVAVGGPDWK